MDIRTNKNLIAENLYLCKFNAYKQLSILKLQKNFYNYNFETSEPYEYCAVDIRPVHSIDTSYDYSSNNYKPVILNFVSGEYDGYDQNFCNHFKDNIICIRTNFCTTLNSSNVFPLKSGEIAYSPLVHIIRDSNFNLLDIKQIYGISVITATLNKNAQFVGDNISSDDYTNLLELLETIFQTAILGGNDVLILNDFGCVSENYPVDDIINMINSCIYKYGHMLKFVVISINILNKDTMKKFTIIRNKIIKPQIFIDEYMHQQNINLTKNF